jgi:hypothetical protein
MVYSWLNKPEAIYCRYGIGQNRIKPILFSIPCGFGLKNTSTAPLIIAYAANSEMSKLLRIMPDVIKVIGIDKVFAYNGVNTTEKT